MSLFEISLPQTLARALRLPVKSPRSQQIKVLKNLLQKSRFTEFGQKYRFDEILLSKHPEKAFRSWYPLIIIIKFIKNGGIVYLKAYPMFAGLVK